MNEEIKFLREHIKGICSYKGLQEELTYDVPLDILKRVCIALDYLQQENKQLKEDYNKVVHEATEWEDRYYRLQDKWDVSIIKLENENKYLKDRIEKAIEYIENDLSHIKVVGKRNKSYLLNLLKGDKE